MAVDGPTLKTDRLLLRPTRTEDFEAWADFAADEVVMRFLGGVQPRHAARRGFLMTAGSWALDGFSMFSVIEAATGRWIGRVGPIHPEGWPGTEVGWGLAREAWGQGYAVEAATCAIDWAFEHLGWTDVIHCIEAENIPSQAVARRLGSKVLRSGRLPAPYEDGEVEIWGQSAAEWRSARARQS
jgi:RimJ/RimL family protein N-acetyltransferase